MSETIQSCFKRYEKKYLLTPKQYENMLRGMRPYVTADRYSHYTICNLYYDTDDYQLIRTSLEKPLYKEKLRMRSYGVQSDDGNVFIELKKKYEGVVYKRRAVMDVVSAARYIHEGHNPPQNTQICREIDYFMRSYHPTAKVFIAYDREAWAGNDIPDLRVTFDTHLRARTTDLDLRVSDQGTPILSADQILMELKIPGAAPLWLARLLSDNGIFSTSFSKYGTWYRQAVVSGQIPPHTFRRVYPAASRPADLSASDIPMRGGVRFRPEGQPVCA